MGWARFFAVFFGTVAAVGSRIVAAVIVLTTALALRRIGQQRLVLGFLVPAYAVGRLMLNMLAEIVKEETEKLGG